jgi:hypothetical protein
MAHLSLLATAVQPMARACALVRAFDVTRILNNDIVVKHEVGLAVRIVLIIVIVVVVTY